jgi:hypothetical protein
MMKLKIVHKKYLSGKWYYDIYELRFFFFWVRLFGFFDNLKEAEEYAIEILEEEKIRIKTEKEPPVYYQLEGNKITYKKGDGDERMLMGEPPLKFKKTEDQK